MLTVDMILKKAMKGEIDLVTHAMAVSEEIMGIPISNLLLTTYLSATLTTSRNLKQFLW